MIKRCQILVLLWGVFAAPHMAAASDILVADGNFNKYFANAQPGDVFTIAPGVYTIKKMLKAAPSGTIDRPITVKPSVPGTVTFLVDYKVGIYVTGANWIFEDLQFAGICENDYFCHHAFHIVGNADNLILRRNAMLDFNSTLKANGSDQGGVKLFPDNVLIEDNYIFNRWPRFTKQPVTLIDIVGGNNWVVRRNFIADYEKQLGNKVSYAAFLKGNSVNGLFERNIVMCEWHFKGGTRLGLSFGGGGTGQAYCQHGDCRMEHYKGTMRGNVIMNCPKDVGVYLNKAANTRLIGNTILNTAGVDARFETSFAIVANNIIEGRIKDRDGGRHHDINNIILDKEESEELFPRQSQYDLTPTDMRKLRSADGDYPSVDMCSGDAQSTWVGAYSEPKTCSLRDKVQAAEIKRMSVPKKGDSISAPLGQ